MKLCTGTDFDIYVSFRSQSISRIRKLETLEILDQLPSTPGQMERDWNSACADITKRILLSEVTSAPPEESLWDRLTLCWLDHVKELLAYEIWENRKPQEGIWCSDLQKENHYFSACNELNNWMRDPKFKEPVCPIIIGYLERFVGLTGASSNLVNYEVERIISRKASHLQSITAFSEAECREISAGFVDKFYGNIIPAIQNKGDNASSIRAVLQAVQGESVESVSRRIISSLEAILVIKFLDSDAVNAFESATGRPVF